MDKRLKDRRQEFADFVWNHAADAFQAKFDHCAALSKQDIDTVIGLIRLASGDKVETLAAAIGGVIDEDRGFVRLLLQLTGLTRNKIVQDIKAFVRQEGLQVSTSKPEAIFNRPDGVRLGSEYLARQMIRVFQRVADRVDADVLETVNQATWPGYIRQERAKRMGHEAEFRLACLLKDCGLGFEPAEKAVNPLCRDIIIDGMSYDLVSPSGTQARMRVAATVHTANIGQYGESKDELEIRKAIRSMESAGDRKKTILLAFIDGVGFESNRAGLDGVLRQADEFCQFRTIWKAALIAASVQGRKLTVALPSEQVERFRPLIESYQGEAVSRTPRHATDRWVDAGDAAVRVK